MAPQIARFVSTLQVWSVTPIEGPDLLALGNAHHTRNFQQLEGAFQGQFLELITRKQRRGANGWRLLAQLHIRTKTARFSNDGKQGFGVVAQGVVLARVGQQLFSLLEREVVWKQVGRQVRFGFFALQVRPEAAHPHFNAAVPQSGRGNGADFDGVNLAQPRVNGAS